MSKAPFQSMIQRMAQSQIGSGNRFLGPTRLRRVSMLGKAIVFSYMDIKIRKAEVVKI
jgi:hypothetical protein